MKVTLLGTSSAEGWPALFCRCEACGKARELGGRNIRTRSSALIDDVLKIDFPPDTLHHVIQFNLDLRRINALLFTHAHDDHFSAPELQYLSDYFVPVPIREPLPIYGPPEVIIRLENGLDLRRVPVTLQTLRPWETVVIGSYRVTPIMAQHDPSQHCYNYLITDSDDVTLLYASDTGWYEEPTWKFLGNVRIDGIVAECAKGPIEGGYKAHMCIPEVIRLRSRLIEMGCFQPAQPMVTTHFSHLGGLMHEELEQALTPSSIQVGYDGMIFPVSPTQNANPAVREFSAASA